MTRLPAEIGAALLVATLAACQSVAVQPEEALRADDADEPVAALVDYGLTLRTLDDAEIDELHRNLTLENRDEPSSAVAIRLALLLSYRDSPYYDLDRAINLLNQVARTRRDENPVFPDLAELMSAILIERRSLVVDRNALAEQHAADTDRIEELQNRVDEMQTALSTERERSEKLQSQLDALVELEEQLTLDAAERNGVEDGE